MPELTTAPEVRPEAASGCETVDDFIDADQVQEGDLMLHAGLLCVVESIQEDYSRPAYLGFVLRHGDLPNGWQHAMILRHRLAAVRRYVTTEG